MKNLANSGRSNVVYKLVKGLGTIREDGTDLCFPTKHMPMGLLKNMSDFYSCRTINSVTFVFHMYPSTNYFQVMPVPKVAEASVHLSSQALELYS